MVHFLYHKRYQSYKIFLIFFQVTCYCGRPFAGRPMIECTRCLTWVHLKCAKLTRQRIPETWFCQKCKSLKGNDVISEKNKTTTSLKGKKNDDLRKSSSPIKTLKTIRPSTPNVEKVSGSRKRKLTSRRQKLSTSIYDDNSTKSRRLSAESELSRYPTTTDVMMHDDAWRVGTDVTFLKRPFWLSRPLETNTLNSLLTDIW